MIEATILGIKVVWLFYGGQFAYAVLADPLHRDRHSPGFSMPPAQAFILIAAVMVLWPLLFTAFADDKKGS